MNKLELLKKELKNIKYDTIEKKLININLDKYNYTDDTELNDFLNIKSSEIINIIGNSSIVLGKIFEEVKELCNKKEAENIYCAWLEYNNFNRMTALRYRNRYNIFKKLESTKARELIAITQQKNIDLITKTLEDNKEILNKLNTITKNEDIEKVISSYIITSTDTEETTGLIAKKSYIFKKLEQEINNNNISAVKKEVAEFKKLIQDIESKIEQKIEKNTLDGNLKLYEEE